MIFLGMGRDRSSGVASLKLPHGRPFHCTRSVLVHVIVNALTLLPGAILGVVLLYAGHRHPERAWINLGLALALYVAWYLGGTLTWLARQDTEGADVGWMSHGLFLTVPCGVLAALLF